MNVINEFSTETLKLIGFSLLAKVNGQIVSCSMRMLHAKAESKIDSELESIDGFNDMLASMEALGASNEWFSEAGDPMGRDAQVSPDVELGRWLAVREDIMPLFLPVLKDIPSLQDTYMGVVRNTHKKFELSELDAIKMAGLSGVKPEKLVLTYKKRQAEEVAKTVTAVQQAMEFVSMGGAKGALGEQPELPQLFQEKLQDSFASARKFVRKYPRGIEEDMSTLIMLKLDEDLI